MNQMNQVAIQQILPLGIALLAVFFGPLIQWKIAKRQVIGPMRQAWINDLRKKLADLCGSASFYMAAGFRNRDEEVYKRLVVLQYEIELTVNPREENHRNLLIKIREMMTVLAQEPIDQNLFKELNLQTIRLSQEILKTEWNRVKA